MILGAAEDDDMGWSPMVCDIAERSQVALGTPTHRDDLTHAKCGGQPSHNF